MFRLDHTEYFSFVSSVFNIAVYVIRSKKAPDQSIKNTIYKRVTSLFFYSNLDRCIFTYPCLIKTINMEGFLNGL
jgi:hypothetical protein